MSPKPTETKSWNCPHKFPIDWILIWILSNSVLTCTIVKRGNLINSRHTNSHKSSPLNSRIEQSDSFEVSTAFNVHRLEIGTQFENYLANSNRGDNICAGYSDFYFEDSLPSRKSRVEWTKAKQSPDSFTFPILEKRHRLNIPQTCSHWNDRSVREQGLGQGKQEGKFKEMCCTRRLKGNRHEIFILIVSSAWTSDCTPFICLPFTATIHPSTQSSPSNTWNNIRIRAGEEGDGRSSHSATHVGPSGSQMLLQSEEEATWSRITTTNALNSTPSFAEDFPASAIPDLAKSLRFVNGPIPGDVPTPDQTIIFKIPPPFQWQMFFESWQFVVLFHCTTPEIPSSHSWHISVHRKFDFVPVLSTRVPLTRWLDSIGRRWGGISIYVPASS